MTDEAISAIQSQLLTAEGDHDRISKQLDGLERVLLVLDKLGKIREAKSQQMEDTRPVDSLLSEYHVRLNLVLDQSASGSPIDEVDFFAWASAIENDVRAQDPLMLSFDSGSEDDQQPRSKSGRLSRRDGPASRKEGSVSSKGASTLLQVLKSNGKFKRKSDEHARTAERDDRFFCLTTVAWAFAVIGMMITIGFLCGDFWVAQKNVAIQIERSSPTPLELPAVTICGDTPSIPTFSHFPTDEYPGLPLIGISSYIRTNRTESSFRSEVHFPNTLATVENSPVEEVVVAQDGERFRKERQGFNVKREIQSMNEIRTAGSFEVLNARESNGLYCFRVGKRRREVLFPFDPDQKESLFNPSVQISVFKSRLFGACRSSYFQRDALVYEVFAGEFYRHAEVLQQRGILDFSGYDFSVLNETLWDLGQVNHPIDFYCNVYFFAGFFYPTLDNASISYLYNPSHPDIWEKTGAGPYYSAYSWNANASLLLGPDVRALERDTYALSSIRLYAEEAAKAEDSGVVSPSTGISILDMTSTSIYTFKKVNVRGENVYHVKEARSQTPKMNLRVVDHYHVNMDFSTFETERILTAPTMSWPEFLTDVFEFVGLFTGICIFTLIVAPAHSLV